MKELWAPFNIPEFNNLNLSEENQIKCKNLYEQICNLIRSQCGYFEVHIAHYVIHELHENINESMKQNLVMIVEEMKRRGMLNNDDETTFDK